MRDSLVLGATSGAAIGAVAGHQSNGDREENSIRGAVLGAAVGGFVSYLIHNSLESRDSRVRRETLLNLENYDVLGTDYRDIKSTKSRSLGGCFATKEVDGKQMSVPCNFVGESTSAAGDN